MAQIIYGVHPVREALEASHLQFEKILVGTSRPHTPLQAIFDLARSKKIPVMTTDGETLNRLAGGGNHQGIIALVQGTLYAEMDTLLSRWRRGGGKALFLILDGIQDPQNLGSVIRTALGCGVHGVIVPKDRAVGVTPTVVKASAGATAHMPVARVVNIAATLDTLKQEGIWVYGASGEADEVIYHVDLDIDLAIVVGSEGKGIRPLVKKRCDRLFSIPMKGPISSFNASVSTGMILYEIMRQRNLTGGGKRP